MREKLNFKRQFQQVKIQKRVVLLTRSNTQRMAMAAKPRYLFSTRLYAICSTCSKDKEVASILSKMIDTKYRKEEARTSFTQSCKSKESASKE